MVPVVVSTTAGASPLPIGKGKFLIQCATYMAHLAGWKPLIDFREDLSAIPEFILQHVAEHPKAVIVGGLAQLQREAGLYISAFRSSWSHTSYETVFSAPL